MEVLNASLIQGTIEVFGTMLSFVSVLLLFSLTGGKQKSVKILLLLLLVNSYSLLNEAIWYLFGEDGGNIGFFATRFCNFNTYLCHPIEMILATFYLRELLSENVVKEKSILPRVIYTICAILMCCIFVNVPTHFMYNFTELGVYYRNFGWYGYVSLGLLSLFTIFIYIYKNRNFISKGNFIALCIFVMAPIIGVILQTAFINLSLVTSGVSFGLLTLLCTYLYEWAISQEKKNKNRNILVTTTLFVIMIICVSASIWSSSLSVAAISHRHSAENSKLIALTASDIVVNSFEEPITVARTMAKSAILMSKLKLENPSAADDKEITDYLYFLKSGMCYQTTFVVSDSSKKYYTHKGILKALDSTKDDHDIWFNEFQKGIRTYDLGIDVDQANGDRLTVFANSEIRDTGGKFLGICGVGVSLYEIRKVIKGCEKEYNIKITLISETGKYQITSEGADIKKTRWDDKYFNNLPTTEFDYNRVGNKAVMNKYIDSLGWYVVVEDYQPVKINTVKTIAPSVIIFIVGIIIMLIEYKTLTLREEALGKELNSKKLLAETDNLTGVYNRYAYEMATERVRENKEQGRVSLVSLDLNGLKLVNDTLGHAAGDEMIRGAADCMQSAFGEVGDIYRTGGDEFAVLIYDLSKEKLEEAMETLSRTVELWSGEKVKKFTIARGVVRGEDHPDASFKELEELADQRMYDDKNEYYRQFRQSYQRNARPL